MNEGYSYGRCSCGHCNPRWFLNAWICPGDYRDHRDRDRDRGNPRGNFNGSEVDPWDPWDPWSDPWGSWSESSEGPAGPGGPGGPGPWTWTSNQVNHRGYFQPGGSNEWYRSNQEDPWDDLHPIQDPWVVHSGPSAPSSGRDPWRDPWQNGSDPWQDAWDRPPDRPRRPPWTQGWYSARHPNGQAARPPRRREQRSVSPPRSMSPPRWQEEEHFPPAWQNRGDFDDLPPMTVQSWLPDPWGDGLADLLGAANLDRHLLPGLHGPLRYVPPHMRHGGRHLPYDDDGSDSDDPELMRALEESLRTAEAEEQHRVAADREQQERVSGQCVVCFEEKHGGAACCISIPGSGSTTDTVTERAIHFICHQCIPMYVESELQNDDNSDRRLMERRAFGHCLRCPCSPMPLNCGGFLEERHVRPFLTPALWSQLQAASEADAKHLQWQKESRDNEDPEFLREALLRSMPNAVQCGSCQYGPIDHAGCEDLDAHHWQWQGNSQIQNQCPKCGWWAHSIDSWPSWDGVIRQ